MKRVVVIEHPVQATTKDHRPSDMKQMQQNIDLEDKHMSTRLLADRPTPLTATEPAYEEQSSKARVNMAKFTATR